MGVEELDGERVPKVSKVTPMFGVDGRWLEEDYDG
jgi:hypothetical protein